jgi:hypothetical protein
VVALRRRMLEVAQPEPGAVEVVVMAGEGSVFRRCGCTDPMTGPAVRAGVPAAGGRRPSSACLFEERLTMMAPGWPQSGPTQDQKEDLELTKPQVSTGQVLTFARDLRERALVAGLATG